MFEKVSPYFHPSVPIQTAVCQSPGTRVPKRQMQFVYICPPPPSKKIYIGGMIIAEILAAVDSTSTISSEESSLRTMEDLNLEGMHI